jgi:hypothetical protein
MDHDGHPASEDCDDSNPDVWQNLAYSFRDADGDGYTVAQAGTVCSGASLPKGYSRVAGAPDCDDTDPAAFTTVTGFLDIDGDGFGDGMAMTFCTSGNLPLNYAATGGDCAPADPAAWQNLAYGFRDVDGDGAVVPQAGTVCSGAALPPTYLTSAPAGQAFDCNDSDAAVSIPLTIFVDADHDGFGTGAGQLACTNGAPPAGFATSGTDCDDGDPAVWMSLAYTAVDFDFDGVTVPAVGTRCTAGTLLPPYFATPHGNDCDDANPNVSIALTVFADVDRDGFGAGSAQQACTNGTPPAGFATNGTDCDDGDPAVWMSLVYTAVDFDGDGVTVPAMGTRCTAGTLLPPYFATPHGNDCDDANPNVSIALTVFADGDHDGFGAGAAQQACTNGTPPDGFVTNGTDCNDADASVWALLAYSGIDADGDGVTVPASGQVCTNGTLPPPFKATQHGNDCDDTDPAVDHLAVLYPDLDGDGVGAPPRQITCIGATVPAGLSRGGFDDDDTDPDVIEVDDDELDLLLLGE